MEPFDFKTTPYDHQREAFVASAQKPDYALLMDMGTGYPELGSRDKDAPAGSD